MRATVPIQIPCLLIFLMSKLSTMLTEAKPKHAPFDTRSTLSRTEARETYDIFAQQGHTQGGKDASSGYGGPAITALLKISDFEHCSTVLDYGCGVGKLGELVLDSYGVSENKELHWRGVDQSPVMVRKFTECCVNRFGDERCSVEFLGSGEPGEVKVDNGSVDRFVSTYCLDLLSEEDMYGVLDLAERCLHPDKGLILLAGITWGYRDSFKTFMMTLVWEILYRIKRKKVGGCRPQMLEPYLKARGWRVEKVIRTLPDGFPWMVSEVISARPPKSINHKT